MIGCFNHGPFNCIANKTINSTFFKTKDNEVCDRRNNFVNHPCRCSHLRKTLLFLSDENYLINLGKTRSKINKMWTKKSPKFGSLFSNGHRELWKVQNSLLSHHEPASYSPLTHLHKIPTNLQSPLETVLTPLHRVFESLL